MAEGNAIDVEEKHSAQHGDLGPWCLGVPSAGKQPFTELERTQLRRCLIGRLAIVAAWLLPLPLITVTIALLCHSGLQVALLGIIFPGMVEFTLVLALLCIPENPIKRAFVTYRDFRSGFAYRYLGYFDATQYVAPNRSHLGLNDSFLVLDIHLNLLTQRDAKQSIVRLSNSGRIWTINGEPLKVWITIDHPKPATTSPSPVDNSYSAVGGDSGCFVLLMCVLLPVLIYDIWEPPWYYMIFGFISVVFVATKFMDWLDRKFKDR